MKEKNLIHELNKLKDIKPDSEWKKSNRELLFSQITAQADSTVKVGLFKAFERKLSLSLMRVSQPAVTVFLIILFIFGGSVLSIRAARDTKPGDSLYIAKIISEKTHFALTFSEKKKVELGLEFAGNRAKEISQVLAEQKDEGNIEKVERLKVDFKKEVDEAKTRLTKINNDKKEQEVINNNETAPEVIDTPKDEIALTEEEEGGHMFSANLSKDEQGVQIAENEDLSADSNTDTETSTESEEDVSEIIKETGIDEEVLEDTPTSTPKTEATTTEEVSEDDEVEILSDPEEIINEAEELLDQENYDATLNKLNEAGEAMDNVEADSGEVKGEEESVLEEPVDDEGGVLGVEETDDSASTTEN